MVDLRIERVENGYLVTVANFVCNKGVAGTATCDIQEVHIAAIQDDVAKVIKGILRGAFDSDGDTEVPEEGSTDAEFERSIARGAKATAKRNRDEAKKKGAEKE